MVKIKICCGTSCYIMGASELITLDNYNKNLVEVEGCTCMNLCKDGDKRPPYVTVDGMVYSSVTPDVFNNILKEKSCAL